MLSTKLFHYERKQKPMRENSSFSAATWKRETTNSINFPVYHLQYVNFEIPWHSFGFGSFKRNLPTYATRNVARLNKSQLHKQFCSNTDVFPHRKDSVARPLNRCKFESSDTGLISLHLRLRAFAHLLTTSRCIRRNRSSWWAVQFHPQSMEGMEGSRQFIIQPGVS